MSNNNNSNTKNSKKVKQKVIKELTIRTEVRNILDKFEVGNTKRLSYLYFMNISFTILL